MKYRQAEIGSVVTLRQGFAINKNTKHHISEEPTDLPLLRIADMKDGSQNVFVKDTIPPHFIAKSEDIIYTRTGQVGLVFTKQFGVIHNNCFTVTPNDEGVLSRKYLYYALNNEDFYTKANNLASGAAQPDLPHGAFKSISIYLPPIGVQIRIVDILSAYDDLIENNQKQIKLLEEAAQRLYKEWFVDLRFPGHENTPIVDGVPKGWRKISLGDIAPILTGKKDANFGTKDGAYSFFTCSQEPIKSPSYSFDTSAIILAGNGDFNVKLYRGKFEAYQRTYVLSPIEEKYLYLLYNAVNESMAVLVKGASGSTIKFLTKGMIENIPLFTPTDELLAQYNNCSEAVQRKMKCLKMEIKNATEARDRLLPKLMSGELME